METWKNMLSCFTYTDEVMLREAAGSNVVLQQLLGEVLVHLGCFMGIHGVSKSLVQVCKQNQSKSPFTHSLFFEHRDLSASNVEGLQSQCCYTNINQFKNINEIVLNIIRSHRIPFNSAEDQS